jgi:uncharacterized membrane protein YedE/YeeE
MDHSDNFIQTAIFLGLAGDTPLIPRHIWPFVLALATGIVFGLIGRTKRNAGLLWGISGAVFGLVTAATASGFGNAVSLPYTPSEIRHHQITAFVFSVVVIGIVGVVNGIFSKSSPPLPPP